MTIYEKYIGRTRDSFESLKDAQENYKSLILITLTLHMMLSTNWGQQSLIS